jgi:hypothetical protein
MEHSVLLVDVSGSERPIHRLSVSRFVHDLNALHFVDALHPLLLLLGVKSSDGFIDRC